MAESRAVRHARDEGRAEALRSVRVLLLEAGDMQLSGFAAAELVRRLD